MATTKEELVQHFAGLEISALQRLKKYSELLIIPDEDLLVNATMSQMVDKAHSLADVLFPEWTDRSKSDFGQFLIELFALFSEKDFWYINAFANEGLMAKMRSYSNAFSKAISMGYTPQTVQGSSAPFTMTFKSGELATYDRGDLIISAGGYTFTNDETFTVAASASDTTQTVTLFEGTRVSEDRTYNGYNVFLRRTNVDITSIRVVIDNVSYTRVNNFGQSSADSTHFTVLPEEDGSCAVYFGSNGFGVQPPLGKGIRVEYRRCNGEASNIATSEATVKDSLPARPSTKASMLTNASGGRDSESMTSIKERAPLFFYSKRAVINEEIAENTLNSFSFIQQSKVQIVGSLVAYRVIPLSGNPELSDLEKQTLAEEFHPYIMVGFTAVNQENNYKDFIATATGELDGKVVIDAIIARGANEETIISSIRQVMDDITNPLISAAYGDEFSVNTTTILLRSRIPGLLSVAFYKNAIGSGNLLSDFTLSPTEIFKRINQDYLLINITRP